MGQRGEPDEAMCTAVRTPDAPGTYGRPRRHDGVNCQNGRRVEDASDADASNRIETGDILEDAWADTIRAHWTFGPDLEELLDAAAQARSRWLQIRALLDEQGLMIPGRYEGVERVNPLVAAEARARESFIRALRALRLPDTA